MRGTRSWLASASDATSTGLTALRPDLADLIERFDADAAAGIGDRLRGLLAARVAQLVGDEVGLAAVPADLRAQASAWPTHPDVSATERAVLDLGETFVMDVHSVTDEQVARVHAAVGDAGTVAVFMNLALLDGFTKFRRVFTATDHEEG